MHDMYIKSVVHLPFLQKLGKMVFVNGRRQNENAIRDLSSISIFL